MVRPTSSAVLPCLFLLLLTLAGCGPKELHIEGMSDGFKWTWNAEDKGMEGTYSFSVQDQNGRPVFGLGGDNFAFFQDGRAADVESLARSTDLRLTLGLVLDSSGSIQEENAERAVLTAAINLVGDLHRRATFRYYQFSTEVEELNDLSQVTFDGRFTSLYDAVMLAARNAVERDEERVIIVFTDGRDNRSATSLEDLLAYLREHQIAVYAIGMGDVDADALQAMADVAGGKATVTRRATALNKVFQEVAQQLAGLYRVTYLSPSRPGPEAHDLRFVVRKGRAQAEVLDRFVVTEGQGSSPCKDGYKLAEHTNILCCAEGRTQSPGSFSCSKCEPNKSGAITRLVPGTSTCCAITTPEKLCRERAAGYILDAKHVRKRFKPPVPSVAREKAAPKEAPKAAPAPAPKPKPEPREEDKPLAKPRLGVQLALVDGGVVVGGIVPGMPGEAAGLEVGDVIVSVDGQEVAEVQETVSRIQGAGRVLQLGLLRKGAPVELKVPLEEAPGAGVEPPITEEPPGADEEPPGADEEPPGADEEPPGAEE